MKIPKEINTKSIREINAYYRSTDDSHLWPINGRFNATERAIRRLRRLRAQGLLCNSGLEYYVLLEHTISQVVNEQY